MMKKLYKILPLFFIVLALQGCVKDLDVVPIDPDVKVASNTFTTPEAYKEGLAKLYAGLAVTGQQGPAGQGDIAGIDEGFSSYLRQLFYMQEFTTDEAVIAWNDQTIKDFHNMTWGAGDNFIRGMYSRIFYQITLANEYIRQSSDANLDSKGFSSADKQKVQEFRAEARFLRALSYYHALDLFGSVPFVTEKDEVGAFLPKQISKKDLFNYIESELKDIENTLPAPKQNEYARADRAAAWALLTELYLNAKVYTGTAHYTDCITYCNKIIGAGYQLAPNYAQMFMADNNQTPGFIFQIAFNGQHTQSYGGTTFIIHAAVGGNMNAGDYGIDGGWAGLRTTSALVDKFSGAGDMRGMFFTNGQSKEINDLSLFTDGYAVTKFTNATSTGADPSDMTFTDTDFPVFRLAEIYLNYAEAVLRGGSGGSKGQAITYVNDLRQRAYGNTAGNVTDINLDFLLDERGRELYWECHRRTDLIRYNKFTTADYVWPWKGGVKARKSVDKKYRLFPIPSADLSANPNLQQNDGY